MELWVVGDGEIAEHAIEEIPELLTRPDIILWLDIEHMDVPAIQLLHDVFKFHPRAIEDCALRSPIPKVHVYGDHVFVVLHAPQQGAAGHVHYVELDQFVGPNYVVSVHGPTNPAVSAEAAKIETGAVLHRMREGRFTPTTPFQLSYALVSALTKRMRDFLSTLTDEVWRLEQRVTAGHLGDPEEFLDEMFRVRHGLITVRTMATLSREVYGRMATRLAFGKGSGQKLLNDEVDQFQRVATMADGQKDYLQGVIEFYQTRTNTKMTIAAERLAVIAAVTLPVTALSSVLGMNLIVNESTHLSALIITLTVMIVMSAMLLIWAKRKGWW